MKLKHALIAGLLSLGCVTPIWAQAPEPQGHVLNLTDVEIQTLIDDVSAITGYTFVVHPDVRARVTVASQVPMSTREVFQVFLSTLRVNGYTAVPAGKDFYRIEPEAIAAFSGSGRVSGDNSFVTEVFRLNHFSAVEAGKMIQPLLGPLGQVSASPASNAIIVVDYGSNFNRLRTLVDQIDEDRSVTRTVALETVPAIEMQEILTNLQGESVSSRGRIPFSAIAAEASNSVILQGDAEYVARAEALVKELDVKSGLKRETRVVRLSHAEAASILPILQEVADSAGTEDGVNTNSRASIALHEPSNTLIISAIPETLAALTRITTELDVRRKQVLVEAIIVDVSDTVERELGLQFLLSDTDGNVPFVSSTFSNAAPNLLALTGALAGDDVTEGLGGSSVFQQAATASLLGLTGGTVGFGGQSGSTLFNVVLNALEQDEESNILSKPSILTLNNEPALVSVGQEIPISSGQVLGDANLNPFQTTERREIGVILNVTPRIGDDNTISLEINQEVSSIDAAIGSTVTPDFILNQSQIQANIIADNGELVVLGGLIQAQDTISVEKVPLLGDVPGLGRLFQNEEKARGRSNLMVFIRPTIIETAEDAKAATEQSYNYIRAQQILANEGGPASLDELVGETFNVPDAIDLPDVADRKGE